MVLLIGQGKHRVDGPSLQHGISNEQRLLMFRFVKCSLFPPSVELIAVRDRKVVYHRCFPHQPV